ncbi:AmmeMemoRadiSam system radical SAM enzyme [Sulfolobales archaeon HS-7]|nr:AmmeMemoRadiSam system radical SAM enzyme [Sulfolobales archaeon HS-7]
MGKEASLYIRGEGNALRCVACARRCLLREGQTGFCGVRTNINGSLYLDVYGRVASVAIDPIEKKPVVHFNPGSRIFSFSTTGCSWMCAYCQNYEISQRRKVEGVELDPSEIVDMARAYESDGIAFTYNEPIIFSEFAQDVSKIARKYNIFTIYVTNGYGTPELVGYLREFLSAATIDFKGNGDEKFLKRYVGASGPEPIFETAEGLKKAGIHVEITDLVIPEIGASLENARRLARFIVDKLGPDTPLHFLRFHSDYKLMGIPHTPIPLLEAHYKVAKEEGLNYVYLGNVPGHPFENTYCHNCGREVIRRNGFRILSWNLTEDMRCKFCDNKIPIEGKLSKHAFEDRFEQVWL